MTHAYLQRHVLYEVAYFFPASFHEYKRVRAPSTTAY